MSYENFVEVIKTYLTDYLSEKLATEAAKEIAEYVRFELKENRLQEMEGVEQ